MSCTNGQSAERIVDVAVIGGGPAGSTAATKLSKLGRSVKLFEQTQHPRFHIGESLLPQNLEIFEELGVLDSVQDIGVLKPGADFTTLTSEAHVSFRFAEALTPQFKHAYQVRRSEFDHLLLRNAQEKGVDVFESYSVQDCDFSNPDYVEVVTKDADGAVNRHAARFVIDASGRDTFLSRRFGLWERNRQHESAAIFSHFRNVQWRSGEDEGNISIYWFEHGWFWLIPISREITSVGMVAKPNFLKASPGSIESKFQQGVEANPALKARMTNAIRDGQMRSTGNFSYSSNKLFGDRFALVGDAFAFIDPVFSTGVFVAMRSGSSIGEAVDIYLADRSSGIRALRRHEAEVRSMLKTFSWFIYRFMEPSMKTLFMSTNNRFQIRSAVISLLSGRYAGDIDFRARLFAFKCLFVVLEWYRAVFGAKQPTNSRLL